MDITINVAVSAKIQKNIMCAKDGYTWNPAACSCKNGKYVISIIADLMITCDAVIPRQKNVPIKKYFNKNCSRFLFFEEVS